MRFEGGLTSETVFQQAKVEYASTAALIPDLERKIEVMENSISLLMGENPDWRVVRSKMNTEAEFAESLPVGLPSELLLRRPDVRASEQQLRAAMAAAGMAYADRFPRIVFNLTGGWENDDVSGFFRSPFSYVAGTLASPIFGFGRKQARYKAALAAYDEAGGTLRGFDLATCSEVPAGCGLSSSAAFEVMVGAVLEALFGPGPFAGTSSPAPAQDAVEEEGGRFVPLDPVALALAGVTAEQRYFGKPCGAQDQLASACGGTVLLDFGPKVPTVTPLAFDAKIGRASCRERV